ncbi:hypothetical protein CCR75_003696 [Bremia lactucae]|uniref:FYVE-type domain-containing protein n=1 Tax=Bremia lactucae TaxID=4779 RepID=A0A976NYY5_BRELC|nr:hypothetical protein CCR75_003696 [Bremia lactucae]
MPSTFSAFAPVSLTGSQETRLELMMKQQVQDAILARSTCSSSTFDSEWRFASSLGQLKTYTLRGTDSFNSTSSWATTLKNSKRATAVSMDDQESSLSHLSNQSSAQRRRKLLSFSRRTCGAPSGRQDPLDPRPSLQSYRTIGRVQGHYRDIVNVYIAPTSADFVRQQKLLSPVVLDGAILHTIRASRDSYFGIKWVVENSFAGKRDICFVEIVGCTTDSKGQEIGFIAMASIDIPECPELSTSRKLTRVRMKRTILVAPSIDTLKGASDVFVMGSSETSESSFVTHAQYRLNMAILSDISLVIDSQNIAKQTLAPMKNWIPDDSRLSCSICCRKFHLMYRRRHHCRLCGDVICKTCYVTRGVRTADMEETRGVEAIEICQTKFCVRCVMGLRTTDKRLTMLARHLNNMLLLRVDPIDMSVSKAESEPTMPSSTVTFFKRGSTHKHALDFYQFYKKSPSQDQSQEMENNQANGTNARAFISGYMVSYGSGTSSSFRTSPIKEQFL